MPTLEENIDHWEKEYTWHDGGEEWSKAWGDSTTQWLGSIYLRIGKYLPVGNLLEIAPGYGRWTGHLHPYCSRLQAVDVSGKCIAYCKSKFREVSHASFYKNDGRSLAMIEPDSIDFVFSFDSFVHFDHHTTNCYINEIAEKLKEDGMGFIHHSNIGCHFDYIKNEGWRSVDVSHKSFEEICKQNGLACISQELVTWGTNKEALTDCFSLFTKTKTHIANKVVENYLFVEEAAWLYSLF